MSPSPPPPLPTPPFITIPNIANLRTATHSLRTPSGPLRSDILFRSASVTSLDAGGWSSLASLGIAHVFDLRSLPEIEKDSASKSASASASNGNKDAENEKDKEEQWMQDMRAAGVERSWTPVFATKDYSPAGLATRYMKYMSHSVSGFVSAYRDILRSGGPAYRTIFLYLANLAPASPDTADERRAALIHCTAGKDRTGVFFGILFDFLGVPRAHIAREYHLTDQGLASIRDDVVARLLQSPGFQKYMLSLMAGEQMSADEAARVLEEGDVRGAETVEFPPSVWEEGRQAALRMVGAREESMLAMLEMVDREFDGSERYMRDVCGLNDDDLERLRRVLIVRD